MVAFGIDPESFWDRMTFAQVMALVDEHNAAQKRQPEPPRQQASVADLKEWLAPGRQWGVVDDE